MWSHLRTTFLGSHSYGIAFNSSASDASLLRSKNNLSASAIHREYAISRLCKACKISVVCFTLARWRCTLASLSRRASSARRRSVISCAESSTGIVFTLTSLVNLNEVVLRNRTISPHSSFRRNAKAVRTFPRFCLSVASHAPPFTVRHFHFKFTSVEDFIDIFWCHGPRNVSASPVVCWIENFHFTFPFAGGINRRKLSVGISMTNTKRVPFGACCGSLRYAGLLFHPAACRRSKSARLIFSAIISP
jgi:hypothetical protein